MEMETRALLRLPTRTTDTVGAEAAGAREGVDEAERRTAMPRLPPLPQALRCRKHLDAATVSHSHSN